MVTISLLNCCCSYAGELPSGAFGVNNHGVGFTLNYVEPAKAVWPGIARNFVSRSLLDSVSFADGVRRATVKNLASGHNTQVLQCCTPLQLSCDIVIML